VADLQPELLGHHYTEAGLLEQAIPYWQRAGEIAVRRSANSEAVGHFTKGIELLKTLKTTPERLKQELTLQIALYAPLAGAKAYGTPEVEKAYDRALKLCEQVGEPTQLFLVIYGQWGLNLVRSEFRKTRRFAEQGLTLAKSIQNPALLMEAHRWTDESSFYRGEFALAREHFEKSLALYDPKKHHTHAHVYGQDPGIALLSHGSLILWQLGYPDQAMKRAEEALAHARDWPHPFSHAFALCYGAVLYQYCQEVNKTKERVDKLITLSKEQRFPLWLAFATVLHGWVLFEQSKIEKGISQIRKGMADMRAIWNEMWRTRDLALLAEAYRETEQVEEGLKLLDEALAMVDATEQRHYEAELNRLKGQFLLMQDEAESETYFHKAIDVARSQSARSMELRASVSLSRLWQKQGKKNEARKLLSKIYVWFTEGFDTTDLKDAKALLDELS
jgi:predicted ATPase